MAVMAGRSTAKPFAPVDGIALCYGASTILGGMTGSASSLNIYKAFRRHAAPPTGTANARTRHARNCATTSPRLPAGTARSTPATTTKTDHPFIPLRDGMKDDCIHAKRLNKKRYGVGYHDGKFVMMHRLAYCQHHGITLESIKGLVVRHTCDNPPCINPKHLLLGTHADNTRDAIERNRLHRWNGERRGEGNPKVKLTAQQVEEIRAKYAPWSNGYKALAKEYNVTHRTIMDIIQRKTWK